MGLPSPPTAVVGDATHCDGVSADDDGNNKNFDDAIKEDHEVSTAKVGDDNDDCDQLPPPPKKKRRKKELPEVDPSIQERKCESCLMLKPRSKYNKKQWSKVYGGWRCLDCFAQERVKQREDASKAVQTLKQNQHEQKLREQSAKKDGIFMDRRPCFQCTRNKSKTEYSGKQWKKLYRQCQECVTANGFLPTMVIEPEKTTKNKGGYSDGSKYCSGCKESKLKVDFPPQQWAEPVNAERLCTPCYEEEGVAKSEHIQISNNHPNENEKRCYACHRFLPTEEYSSKQVSKKYGICVGCVEIIRQDRKEDLIKAKQVSTRPCSICGIQKKSGEFGRGQWKRSDPRCKVCAVILVQKMDKHRQLEKEYTAKYHNSEEVGGEESIVKEEIQSKKRRCFECGSFLGQGKYSIRQVRV